MPQQLIYTSAPRGVVAGRSGYCTVARSALMREALMLQLEKFCYYQHLSLSGGQERPIFACRIIDIRGTRFHVLSRIQDAGLDFTGRTNFIAHHLVFTPEEIRSFAVPALILRDWPGWAKSWTREPQLLENEDWAKLTALSAKTLVPAQIWQQVTGDAVNGYGLLEARAGASFRVDDLPPETVLGLLAESVALLEIRDSRRDARASAWSHTFTTSMQEQDNPADFRWRCIHADNPAAGRFATPDIRALSEMRCLKSTAEEAALARTGRQALRFAAEPLDVEIKEGEPGRFTAQAEGVPRPVYQWYAIDRGGGEKPLAGETRPELVLANPPLGVSRYRVSATNSAGTVPSRVATLSVNEKLRLARTLVPAEPKAGPEVDSPSGPKSVLKKVYRKTDEEIDRQRHRLEAEKAEEMFHKRQWWKKIFLIMGALIIVAAAGGLVLQRQLSGPEKSRGVKLTNAVAVSPSPMPTPAPVSNFTQIIVVTNTPAGSNPVVLSTTSVPVMKMAVTTNAAQHVEVLSYGSFASNGNTMLKTNPMLKP